MVVPALSTLQKHLFGQGIAQVRALKAFLVFFFLDIKRYNKDRKVASNNALCFTLFSSLHCFPLNEVLIVIIPLSCLKTRNCSLLYNN